MTKLILPPEIPGTPGSPEIFQQNSRIVDEILKLYSLSTPRLGDVRLSTKSTLRDMDMMWVESREQVNGLIFIIREVVSKRKFEKAFSGRELNYATGKTYKPWAQLFIGAVRGESTLIDSGEKDFAWTFPFERNQVERVLSSAVTAHSIYNDAPTYHYPPEARFLTDPSLLAA